MFFGVSYNINNDNKKSGSCLAVLGYWDSSWNCSMQVGRGEEVVVGQGEEVRGCGVYTAPGGGRR